MRRHIGNMVKSQMAQTSRRSRRSYRSRPMIPRLTLTFRILITTARVFKGTTLLVTSRGQVDDETKGENEDQVTEKIQPDSPYTGAVEGFDPGPDHHQVYSQTTPDRKHVDIHFDNIIAYSPNILPHPTRHDRWIVVPQEVSQPLLQEVKHEVTCTLEFVDNAFVCTAPPTVSPVQASVRGTCETE